jgi:choline-glycine betaine transporter
MKTLLYSLAFVLNIAITLAVQIRDKRRLTERQRARSWNAASWGSALYVAGPASMIAWAWVTRSEWAEWRRGGLFGALLQSALVLLAGLGIGAVIYGISVGVVTGIGAALGLPDLD